MASAQETVGFSSSEEDRAILELEKERAAEAAAGVGGGVGDDELEEGEILDDEDSAASAAGGGSITSATQPQHPLEHSWTFWFDNPSAKSKQVAWGSSIRPIHTFSTVEEFWSLYNNIRNPSKLAVGADFQCFKYKIEPKWEDPVCANGGKWTISCARGKADTWWLYTLLAMIGEQFDHGDEICGAVVSLRGKLDKISIWTKNASNEPAQISIGRQWKEFLDYSESIGFIVHDDARKHDRFAKNAYTV
ncbi:Eukaryotic translation initiation factor 4E-1 [Asimina triloba]